MKKARNNPKSKISTGRAASNDDLYHNWLTMVKSNDGYFKV